MCVQCPDNLVCEAKASLHISVGFHPSHPTVERPNIFYSRYIGRKLAPDHVSESSNNVLPLERHGLTMSSKIWSRESNSGSHYESPLPEVPHK